MADQLLSLLTKGLKFNKSNKLSGKNSENNITNDIVKREIYPTSIDKFRKEEKIRVFGIDVPKPIFLFTEIGLPKRYIEKMDQLLICKPTLIQMQSIPILLANRDLMACAPTGSGKTLSFLIPIFISLEIHIKHGGFRALILTPTRELAEQIYRDILLISRQDFKTCVLTASILNGFQSSRSYSFDILISTPMLLVDALKRNIIDLSSIKISVFDEADKLLEESFLEQTDSILQFLPQKSIKALFTATLSSTAESLAFTFLKNDPVRLFIGTDNAATKTISQKLVFVGEESGKLLALKQLIHGDYSSSVDDNFKGLQPPALIFVDTILSAITLESQLSSEGLPISSIHSGKNHAERSKLVEDFRLGKIWVLITTELLARGIDFKGVNSILNYDFPDSAASYIHRIGRTGRAGRTGVAVTLFSIEDSEKLRSIANVMKASGCAVPAYMLELKKTKKKDLIKMKQSTKGQYARGSGSLRPRKKKANLGEQLREEDSHKAIPQT